MVKYKWGKRIQFRARRGLLLTHAGPQETTVDHRGLRKPAGKDLGPSFTPQNRNHLNTEAAETNSPAHTPLPNTAPCGICESRMDLRISPFISTHLCPQFTPYVCFYFLFSIIWFLLLPMSLGSFVFICRLLGSASGPLLRFL